jgi:hypothetical protein
VWRWTQEPAAELGVAIGSIEEFEVGASGIKQRSEFDATALASSVIGSELFVTAGVIGEVAVPIPWVMER